jgi:hypothetical protein
MSLSLYGDRRSGNCLKVLWTVQKLGLEHRWIDIDVTRAETRTADFLAMNPAGQVPLVVFEDGFALAQSNAIIMHLADIYGGGLVPEDDRQRARMYEWLFWEHLCCWMGNTLGVSERLMTSAPYEKTCANTTHWALGLNRTNWDQRGPLATTRGGTGGGTYVAAAPPRRNDYDCKWQRFEPGEAHASRSGGIHPRSRR